jgi:hypothetical protein
MFDGNENTFTATTAQESSVLSADELRDKLTALQAAHEAFRTQVRDRAIQGHHEGEWDMDSLNTTLERLDLATYEPKRLVRSQLRLEVVLEADTDDANRAWSVLQDLENLSARQAFQEAIANVVQTHLTGDLAVTSSGSALSATVGYPRVEVA